jgi:hypothetical protein
MTEFLFPDNTVLCNFATVECLDLLISVLRGRGRWTEAVAHEAQRSAQVIPALASLLASPELAEPIEISADADILQVERIRRAVFGGTDDEPLRHLGEAQTCHVIETWPALAGSWWISDDREAVRYARRRGITTRETIDLVAMAVADGDISPKDGYALLCRMASAGRHLRLPASAADLTRL